MRFGRMLKVTAAATLSVAGFFWGLTGEPQPNEATDSFMWSDSLTESMSVNVWVDHQ